MSDYRPENPHDGYQPTQGQQGYGQYGAPMPPIEAGEQVPQVRVGDALGYGWRGFKANAGAFVVIGLIVFAVSALYTVLGGQDGGVIVEVIAQIVTLVIAAAAIKGALDVASGRPVSLGAMFEGWSKLHVLVAAVLVAVGTILGLLLLVIPGLIWIFLTWFTNYAIIDRGQDAFAAIGTSIRLVSSHVGTLLVLMLACVGVLILGGLALVVGLLVAMPVVLIANAYAFRVLSGQPVAVLD